MTPLNTFKQIGFVNDLLKEYEIKSVNDLRRLIAGKGSIGKSRSFSILRPSDLLLDNESRSYESKFEYSCVIFDCPTILLRNSRNIRLLDCIFLGTIDIGRKEEYAPAVYMDSCLIEQALRVGMTGEVAPQISFTNIWAAEFRLYDLRTDDVEIFGSSFGNSELDRVVARRLTMFGNSMGIFEVFDCQFGDVSFARGQLDVFEQTGTRFRRRASARTDRFDVFSEKAAGRKVANSFDDEPSRRQVETFDFLLSQTEIRRNKHDASHVKYLRSIAESHGVSSRLFVIATGAFLKPVRILILAAAIVFLFGLVYSSSICLFTKGSVGPVPISIPEGIYFSAVTFTTVGYGDITPVNGVRFLAMVEAFLGIVVSSALAVSIARRYIE